MTVMVLLVVLAGCPLQVIDNQIANQMLDDAPPSVSISNPTDNSSYSQTVTVSGAVTDLDGAVRSLDYVVSGALGVLLDESAGEGAIAADGSFVFTFSTIGFTGPLELRVRAVDWNDNVAEATVSLQYSGSQLSSFAASAGNKEVSLSWEPLPEADSYTIYYTDNGTLPSGTYGSTVQVSGSSYDMTDLKNGALHTFLLSANDGGTPIYWSNYVKTIPLSQFTLAPRVAGGYRKIELEWQDISGASNYEVYRATSPEGPYSNYTGTITGASFTDTGVSEGEWYYYKVKPSLAGTPLSTHNGAEPVTIPVANQQISSISTPAATQKVAKSGDYAYVAAGSSGIFVVDVSDPSRPRHVGSVDTVDAKDIVADGTYVYVADGSGGVTVIDASIPGAPQIVDTYIGSIGDATFMDLDDVKNTLFVVDVAGGTNILAFDVTTPSDLQLLDEFSSATRAYGDIAVRNYSSTYSFFYLTAIDPTGTVSDTYLLEYYYYYGSGGSGPGIHSFRSYAADTGSGEPVPSVVETDGTNVFVLSVVPFDIEPPSEYQLSTFSAFPSSFARLGVADESGETKSGYVADLAVVGDEAFIVDDYVLHIFDVSTLSDPDPKYTLDTPGSPSGVAVDGDYAFLAPGTPFFQTVDLNLPNGPVVEGDYTASSVDDVRVRGDRAYVTATSPTRLQLVDISNPAEPSARGSYELTGASGVALTGDYAVVAAGSSGLHVIDTSNPDAPVPVGSAMPIAGNLVAVDILGDYVFAAGNGGLQIYDIADPANPVGVALVDSDPGGMKDVHIRGTIAYVIDGAYFQPTSLKIIGIEDPTSPFLVDSVYGVATDINRLAVSGDNAFITDSLRGIQIVDINPSSADYLTRYGPYDPDETGFPSADGVVAFGSYALVGTSEAGLAVVDVADPSSISLISSSGSFGGVPEVVRLSGSRAYVAGGSAGLKIVGLRP